MNTEEPIDTTLPWSRKPYLEPVTQVEFERQMFLKEVDAQYEKDRRRIETEEHVKRSILTATYEPNRPAAPDAQSIIDKKGLKAPNKVEITTGDKLVVGTVCFCIAAIVGILLYLFVSLG